MPLPEKHCKGLETRDVWSHSDSLFKHRTVQKIYSKLETARVYEVTVSLADLFSAFSSVADVSV